MDDLVERSECSIHDLPEEILEYILNLVSPYRDLKNLIRTNKDWRHRVEVLISQLRARFVRAFHDRDVAWTRLGPNEIITSRYAHTACVYGSNMYVFGGCTTTNTTFNDLWKLDLSTREWTRPTAIGSYPSPKAWASLVQNKDSLILFGGWTQPSPYPFHQSWKMYNQLHIFEPADNKWTEILTPVLSPPSMAGHSATVHGSTMVVFGGLQKRNNGRTSNDVWLLDLVQREWRFCKINDNLKPHPRCGQSQVHLDDSNLLVIGGCGGMNTLYSDIWLLNLEINCWQEMTVVNPEFSAPFLWCHPAVKISEQYVAVVSQASRFQKLKDMASPGNASRKFASVLRASRTPGGERPKLEPQDDFSPTFIPFVSGNLQPQSAPSPDPQPSTSSGSIHNTAQPSVRPNAMKNRAKQLESLRRMEVRLQSLSSQLPKPDVPNPFCPIPDRKPGPVTEYVGNPCHLYILDISEVLTKGVVTWVPEPDRKCCESICLPEDSMMHTLVMGECELIMFGGVQKDTMSAHWGNANASSNPDVVSNTTYFIKPSRKPLA